MLKSEMDTKLVKNSQNTLNGYLQSTVNSHFNVFWLFTDKSDIFNGVDLIFEYSMNIF